MSKAVENLRWKVQCKEFLLEENKISDILTWVNEYFIDIKTGARDLRTVLHDALKDLLNSPYTKLPDDKKDLFEDLLEVYDSEGSFNRFKIGESTIAGETQTIFN